MFLPALLTEGRRRETSRWRSRVWRPRAGLVTSHSGGLGAGIDRHSPRCPLIDVVDEYTGFLWIGVPDTSLSCPLSATYLTSRYRL